jgi:hypothetical protein
MSDPEETQDQGFTVIDRRGSAREEERAEPPPPSEPPPRPTPDATPGAERTVSSEPGAESPLPIDFGTFVLSLFSSALYHMGVAPDPASGQPPPERNLVLARQTIDTLEMLQEKTRGNLDAEEAHLIENALYELRMRFVEASK